VDSFSQREDLFKGLMERIMSTEGTKHDQGKPMLNLIDPQAIEGLAAVLTFGAKKYAADNWRSGISNSRLIASLLRHLFAIMRGEYTDPESGLPHIDHVGCNWMFLSNNLKNRPDLNDSWFNNENRTTKS
jgi:hypothetical protein